MNDETTKENVFLSSSDLQQYYKAARWGRFLAIIGFCASCLMVLAAFFSWGMFKNAHISEADHGSMIQARLVSLFLPILGLLYFIPSILLYRFSVGAMNAVRKNSQPDISISVTRLFLFFKFIGILTIIILAIYALLIVVAGIASIFGWGRY